MPLRRPRQYVGRALSRGGSSPLSPRVLMRTAVLWFVVGSVVAVAVVMVGGFFVLRGVSIQEATRDTRERVRAEGRLVEVAGLSDAVLTGDADALRRLNTVVTGQVLGGSIVRVKIWTREGRILYSDEPALVGQRFALGDEERELFDSGQADAELSDLSQPENRFERGEHKLLEAHTVVHTPDGTPLLFEIYQRFSAVSASGTRLLQTLAPVLIGGFVVLLMFQVPLAWTMARRLQRGHREREALLRNAIEASARERGRIAAGLHDGVVQDLAGVAFGLAPLIATAQRRGDDHDASVLRRASATLRQGIRDLRTLLVEIHPRNLEATGLRVALSDLLSPLQGSGIQTSLHVDDHRRGSVTDHDGESMGVLDTDASDPVVYQVAREAVRNAHLHANPKSVDVRLVRDEAATWLTVTDDGRGFSGAQRRGRSAEGHVGLTLLDEMVAQYHGRLDVRSTPGEGTTVELRLPVP